MLKKILVFILLAFFTTTQFSSLHTMTNKNNEEVDNDDLMNMYQPRRLTEILFNGTLKLFFETKTLLKKSFAHRKNLMIILTTALIIDYLTKIQIDTFVPNQSSIQSLKEIVSTYFTQTKETGLCITEDQILMHPIFCAVAYGNKCSDNRTYTSLFRVNYNLLYEGVRQCIETNRYEQLECFNELIRKILSRI